MNHYRTMNHDRFGGVVYPLSPWYATLPYLKDFSSHWRLMFNFFNNTEQSM